MRSIIISSFLLFITTGSVLAGQYLAAFIPDPEPMLSPFRKVTLQNLLGLCLLYWIFWAFKRYRSKQADKKKSDIKQDSTQSRSINFTVLEPPPFPAEANRTTHLQDPVSANDGQGKAYTEDESTRQLFISKTSSEKRIEKLETELNHAKEEIRLARKLMISGFAVVVVLVIIAAVLVYRGTNTANPKEHVKTADSFIPDVVRAGKFEVVDRNGTTRAMLSVSMNSSSLRMSDEYGKERVILHVDNQAGPYLFMKDGNGMTRALLSGDKNAPFFHLSDEKSNICVVLSADCIGSKMSLKGKNGETRLELKGSLGGSAMYLYDEKNQLRSTLSTYKDLDGLYLSDEKGMLRAKFSADKDGPRLVMVDEKSNVIRAIK